MTSKKKIAYWTLLLITLSLLAQPTNIRPFGIPLTITFIAAFNLYYITFKYKFKYSHFIVVILIPTFLVVMDLLFGLSIRGTIMSLLMLFAFFASKLDLSENEMEILWKVISWVSITLLLIGFYRYISGYAAPNSENEDGIRNIEKLYFYLGIGYLPSTRNSDAMYFLIGLLASTRIYLTVDKYKFIYLIFMIAQSIVITLTLARWSYLAAILSLYIMLNKKQKIKTIITGSLVAAALSIGSIYVLKIETDTLSNIYTLIENAILSLLDSDMANKNVSGYYTYSNDERTELYLSSFKQFLLWPFGQGVDNIFFGSANTGTELLHSENLYLDLLISLGITSIIPIYLFGKEIFLSIKNRKSSINARTSAGVLVSCAIFALFNSPIDLAVFWFFMSIGLAESNRSNKVFKMESKGKIESPVIK